MNAVLRAARVTLVQATPERLRAKFSDGFPPEVSPIWIEKLQTASEPDPWVFGYDVVHSALHKAIGSASFKGPPNDDGIVEIAYGIDDAFQRQGYATEVATALADAALTESRVRVVCAHTLPQPGPSPRVLEKSGFTRVGDVVDPEDGLLWRFEKRGL